MGQRASDEARCEGLAEAIVGTLPALLAERGAFVMKTFMNTPLDALRKRLRQSFERVQLVRPESSRQGSSECYLVASGYRVPSGGCG